MRQSVHMSDAQSRSAVHAQRLIDGVAELRVPELFREYPRTLYNVPDRGGVATVAVFTHDLHETELLAIMRFRLVQALMAKLVYPLQAYEAGWEHEPLENVLQDDVHIVAGSAASGEILCYATLRSAKDGCPDLPLRSLRRPLLPIEQSFGWGIYNHLRVLPNVPVSDIRELGRFIKNQRLARSSELGARAPIEIGAAIFRLLTGPLQPQVKALVGEFEERGAKRNLDFFHSPTLMLHGAIPHVSEQSYLFRRFRERECVPFAILTADISTSIPRLEAVERALALSGAQAIQALLTLKSDVRCPRSSLEPAV